MTPNLVWNLILNVEPKIAKMKKLPALKGSQNSPGKKMGTTELRRFLTHSIYGVLSGKNVSPDLSDKIAKISKASEHLDVIVKAAKDGNRRAMEAEMEKIVKDDAYFMELMSQEIEDLIKTKQEE